MTTPNHYKLPNGIQLIDLLITQDFCSGNVIKYIVRAGKKEGNTRLQDLKKALSYLERMIEEEEKEQWSSPISTDHEENEDTAVFNAFCKATEWCNLIDLLTAFYADTYGSTEIGDMATDMLSDILNINECFYDPTSDLYNTRIVLKAKVNEYCNKYLGTDDETPNKSKFRKLCKEWVDYEYTKNGQYLANYNTQTNETE